MNTTQAPAKTVQDIQLDLIKLASFNDFDGERVKQELIENRDLWKGAIIGRFDRCLLLPLRDIAHNIWNVDTLMILPREGKEAELLELVATWRPDDFELLEGEEVARQYGNGESKVIRVWWD